MNNECLKAWIKEQGDKIFLIMLNNGRKVILGVSGVDYRRNKTDLTPMDIPVCTGDIQFKTVGDTDFFGIPHVDQSWERKKIPYVTWYVTQFIEAIFTTDELGEDIPNIIGYI